MPVFAQKSIAAPSRVCLRLREKREAKRLSLDNLSIITKISRHHLLAIEECRFADIPYALVYKKNFLKGYAEAVGADADAVVAQFLDEEMAAPRLVPAAATHSGGVSARNVPALVRVGALAVMIGAVMSYLGVQIKHIVEPPALAVYSPPDGYVTADQALVVQGQAEGETRISINGQTIKNAEDGQFKELLDLSPGMNVITIAAQKKHGKTTTQTRYVILKDGQAFTAKR